MALAPRGVEAEPGDKITQLIRHLWHISGSFLLEKVLPDKTVFVDRSLQTITFLTIQSVFRTFKFVGF